MNMKVKILSILFALGYLLFCNVYIYGIFGPSLLIESTNSMIIMQHD